MRGPERTRPGRVMGYSACSARWVFSASVIAQPSRSTSCAAAALLTPADPDAAIRGSAQSRAGTRTPDPSLRVACLEANSALESQIVFGYSDRAG